MSLPGILSIWEQSEEFKNVIKIVQNKETYETYIFGLNDNVCPIFISAMQIETEKPLLVITDTQEHALRVYQDINTFLNKFSRNKAEVMLFPSFDVLPYENINPDPQVIQKRINVLKELTLDFQKREKTVLVADAKALLPKLTSPRSFQKSSLELKIGHLLKKDEFISLLVNKKYHTVEIVEERGEFSSRGGIIDFFPMASENPIRLELFGDQIESIRYFSPSTQRSLKKINHYTFSPFQQYAERSISNYYYSTLFDYISPDTIIIFNEIKKVKEKVEEFQEEIDDIHSKTKKDQIEKIFSPSSYFIFWQELKEKLKNKKIFIFNYFSEEIKNISKNSEKNINKYFLKSQRLNSYFGNLDLFTKDLQVWKNKKENIIILVRNEGRANRLAEILEERGISQFTLDGMDQYQIKNDYGIFITHGYFSGGFRLYHPALYFITDNEIFGKERRKRYRLPKYKSQTLTTIMDISPGEYVVHVNHGIGIYRGIINKDVGGFKQDYLLVEYASDDKLFVPVDQFHLVHKYVGIKAKSPKVHRLGGISWGSAKKRVKYSIQKMAEELYYLYITRKKARGFSFSKDTNWQQELEMSFPFEETRDQLIALSEVKTDMEIARPMERLVCGDVGYGKTEIAIRAAFKAVMDGKQVAVLAPTTILAQQHHDTFRERINSFPVHIDMLSRFRTKGEQKNILKKIKSGDVDIVIGTHRLVQNDIEFKDLGLLIIDEEQRFGVVHKEKIKRMKESIDSLTLTATPIPRTLHMSLVGARDLSVISTPPENRFPIATYISQRQNNVIIEAIRRELDRGGQVFFVHNRVKSIYKIARDLNRMIPAAKIGIAHGQMAEEELEDVMIDFLEKRYDILVCTTIIEIGLDIPNVNTIIVDNAHRFGLSQLYQLRGRVGRTDRRAYAYFLYPKIDSITETAKKRLEAIKEFSELGSGFKLAMRDLEIRGAGNLLGKEQHGFVSEIGFNLYCSLLEEAIQELKEGEKHPGKMEKKKDKILPLVEIKIDAYIPREYIPDLKQRLLYYQKLAPVTQMEELEEIKEELKDRYGVFLNKVRNLLEIVYLKISLQKLFIEHLEVKEHRLIIRYQNISEIEKKLEKMPLYFRKRIKEEKRAKQGISNLDISDIKNKDILKFLKEFVINLTK